MKQTYFIVTDGTRYAIGKSIGEPILSPYEDWNLLAWGFATREEAEKEARSDERFWEALG